MPLTIDADAHVVAGAAFAVLALGRWPEHVKLAPAPDGAPAFPIEGRRYPERSGPGAGCPTEHGLTRAAGDAWMPAGVLAGADREGIGRRVVFPSLALGVTGSCDRISQARGSGAASPTPRGAALMRRAAGLAIALAAALACASPDPPPPSPAAPASPFRADAVTMDPPAIDPAHPPRLLPMPVESDGAPLNGIAYLADGPGPHPTAVLLHGFPGNERNLDLAQALRRGGWNVLFFHYRGTWGSGGDFSFRKAHDDVAAVLWTARSLEFARAHRVDPRRIALVGHSMGGFLALQIAAEDPAVTCAVSIAGANLGALGRVLAADPARAREAAASFEASSGAVRGLGGPEAVRELVAGASALDLVGLAPALAARRLLLVAASDDTDTPRELHHDPVVSALRAARALHTTEAVLPGDHAFSVSRIALARRVLRWLDDECRPSAPADPGRTL